MNPILLAAVADRLARQLSRDVGTAHPAPPAPLALEVRLAGGAPSWGGDLRDAVRLRLAAAYVAGEAGAVPIVAAGPERPADATLELRVATRDDVPGVAWTVTGRDDAVVRGGWLPLVASPGPTPPPPTR